MTPEPLPRVVITVVAEVYWHPVEQPSMLAALTLAASNAVKYEGWAVDRVSAEAQFFPPTGDGPGLAPTLSAS